MRINKGSLRIASADDVLTASMTERSSGPISVLPIQCRVSGNLATWRSRLAPWITVSDWDLGGQIEADARIGWGPEVIRVDSVRAVVKDLRAFGNGLFITEPRVRIETGGEWNRLDRRWSCRPSTWTSDALSARLDALAIAFGNRRTRGHVPCPAGGTINFRGGLRQLLNWTRDPALRRSDRIDGVVAGSTTLRSTSDGLSADWTVALHDFSIRQTAPLTVTRAQNGSSIRDALSISGACRCDGGRKSIDLERFAISTAPGAGRFSPPPQIDRTGPRALLVLGKGPLAERSPFSPAICRSWLKYAVPVLANATEIEGHYSIDLDQAAVPLLEYAAAQASGRLSIHSALGRAGGLAAQIAAVVMNVERILGRQSPLGRTGDNEPWLRFPEQRVDIRLTKGRVEHRGLEFLVGDTPVRTEGIVGPDDSLSMVVTIPIRDEWIRANGSLASLRGQAIRVPITGTFTRPEVDIRVLNVLSTRMNRR